MLFCQKARRPYDLLFASFLGVGGVNCSALPKQACFGSYRVCQPRKRYGAFAVRFPGYPYSAAAARKISIGNLSLWSRTPRKMYGTPFSDWTELNGWKYVDVRNGVWQKVRNLVARRSNVGDHVCVDAAQLTSSPDERL